MNQFSWRRMQQFFGGVQGRLTLLITLTVSPVLLAMIFLFYNQAAAQLAAQAEAGLANRGRLLAENLNLWTAGLARPLRLLAQDPLILTMEAQQQQQPLANLSRTLPEVYLAAAVGRSGNWLGRSDAAAGLETGLAGGAFDPNQNVALQPWFQQAFTWNTFGEPVIYQTLLRGSGGRPALVVSTPLRRTVGGTDAGGDALGVLMLATSLEGLSAQLGRLELGADAEAFVVDGQGFLLAHNRPELVQVEGELLPNWSQEPAVAALLAGRAAGLFQYVLPRTDGPGNEQWYAYIQPLPNGWGLALRQPAGSLYAALGQARWLALGLGALGLLLVVLFGWVVVRVFVLRPVGELNAVAAAVAAGDLNRQAAVGARADSFNEFDQLGHTFNEMTLQLRQLVGGLEERVVERTRSLERRSSQFESVALVARNAAALRDLHLLMTELSELISQRFGYYHVGIFLLDEAGEFAVLQASNSEGGRRMLARNHKLRLGQVGIVGFVADTGRARIALDVGADAVFFNNPDLPATRSEIALPLKISGRVIGVLDAQSTEAEAFANDDVEVLQLMADQIALALESVRLLEQSQRAYQEVSALYGERTLQAWQERLSGRRLGYRYDGAALTPLAATAAPGRDEGARSGAARQGGDANTLEAPIRLGENAIGRLRLRRAGRAWTSEESALVTEVLSQVAPALENARLLEEIQTRAQLEVVSSQIAAQAQTSLDLDSVLNTIVREVGQAAGLERARLRLTQDVAGDGEEGPQ